MTAPIACVTGGTGIVGSSIILGLLSRGIKVRLLTRKDFQAQNNIETFRGDLSDPKLLERFICGAKYIFHCAAELKDESKMHEVNVKGTELVAKKARLENIDYFCHLSSVGVIGRTQFKTVDETTPCKPQNEYEKSKLESERIVSEIMKDCGAIILRPTNVVDETHPGILSLPERGSLRDLIKAFLTGKECMHLVHSQNVAAAALFFIDRPPTRVESYIVSCDGTSMDTLSDLWPLYKAFRKGAFLGDISPLPSLPLWIPYFLRFFIRGTGNMGDVRYSSKKLSDAGFVFPLGLKDTVKRIAAAKACNLKS